MEFKRQVVQEYLGGETFHGLSRRHDVSRPLVRVCLEKYETGEFDEDAQAADLIQQYEARVHALERLIGMQALELEFLKGALQNTPRSTGLHPLLPAHRHLRLPRVQANGYRALNLLS